MKSTASTALINHARDLHPKPESRMGAVSYVVRIMSRGRMVKGQTYKELAKDWGMSEASVQQITAEASRHLRLLGERPAILKLTTARVAELLDDDDKAIPAARFLLDAVGGTEQRHRHIIEAIRKAPPEELIADACKDPGARAMMRRELAKYTDDDDGQFLLGHGEEIDADGTDDLEG